MFPWRTYSYTVTELYLPGYMTCVHAQKQVSFNIKSYTSSYLRHELGLGNHPLITLVVVDTGLALLHFDRFLDVFSPGLGIHNTEHDIDLFERQLLSLWNKDPDEDRHGQAEDGEHKECLPSDAVNSGRCNLGDDEVEEPLSCSYERG
jgi:hypothetical protein